MLGLVLASTVPEDKTPEEFAGAYNLGFMFLPKYRAWVDLGSESVLYAGETCECCDDREDATS